MADEKRFRNYADIVAFAVGREEEAAAAYSSLMEAASDAPLKLVLGELRDEELVHKRLLLEMAGGLPKGPETQKVQDLGITDFLVEESPHPEMGLQDLLIFAARKERKAAGLYAALAAGAGEGEARKTFEYLAGRETIHKLRIESEYEKLFLGED
jgi:rubrerythrin